MKKLVISIPLTLLLLVSCASTMNWEKNPYALHPQSDYICAVGYGSSAEEADLNARKELASLFGMAVRSTTSRTVIEMGDLEDSTYNEFFASSSEITVDVEALYGVEIAQRKEADGNFASLAAMEKQATRDYYEAAISSDRSRIKAIEDSLGKPDGSFSLIEKAVELILLIDDYNTKVVLYNYLSDIKETFLSVADAKKVFDEARKSVVLHIEVVGDETGTIKSTLSKIFTDGGFAVSKGDLAPTAKALVTIGWQELSGVGNPFVFAAYTADVSVVDLVRNESVLVYTETGREGHQSIEGAKIRAERVLSENLSTQFKETLMSRYTY